MYPHLESHRYIVNAEAQARVKKIPLDSQCTQCGSDRFLVRHHPDYTKPLEIITLCKACHNSLHHPIKVEVNSIPCPVCGSTNSRRNGFKFLFQRKLQLWQCKCCGRSFHE